MKGVEGEAVSEFVGMADWSRETSVWEVRFILGSRDVRVAWWEGRREGE